MYHIQKFKQRYLVVEYSKKKAIAIFHHFNDAKNLLNILNDSETEIEYLKEGKYD